jgi:glycosylphosphatidylinositol deacylase
VRAQCLPESSSVNPLPSRSQVKGVPVLFIPGNAGSYKQVRSLAAEAEYYFAQHIANDEQALAKGKRALDFFTVDFNEDFTAFHGQTLVDQAEYLNDAIAYILSLYHNPSKSRRDSTLPDPSSVILVGHSMGGIVARTMLTMPNYQKGSVNTIITLSAPHARPPVTFDAQIVKTYKTINDYWRRSYSKEWGMDNPLWHVTLISIAGGGLDTIVPSDYASLASLVPDTHGFTVFTSTIPSVWTGMDHLAITWCDEFRKVVIRSLFDVLNVHRPVQTKPRGERMTVFKKWFLSGLEDAAEKSLPHKDPKVLLTLEDNSNSVLAQGERLVLRNLGQDGRKKAYLLPIPPQAASEGRRFTLLTSASMGLAGQSDKLEVLFCSVFPLQAGHSASLFSMNLDFSGEGAASGSTRLACKNAGSDMIQLPASTKHSRYAFDKSPPFSYLQYDLETLGEHQFVAVVDKSDPTSEDFVIAEFSTRAAAWISSTVAVRNLLSSQLSLPLPSQRPLVTDVKIPGLASSLLSYHLSISRGNCPSGSLFEPLVRQYISDVYESKFFVNVHDADINLHGVAPYMPPPLHPGEEHGLSFQIWADPTCDSATHFTLTLDIPGSFGKLWMRYRTLFATFPLLIVGLVLAYQFRIFDDTGVFISFAEGLNQCLRRDIPVALVIILASTIFIGNPSRYPGEPSWYDVYKGNSTGSVSDLAMNNLSFGHPDPFFWFLIPIFGIICAGLCIAINYTVLGITYTLTLLLSRIRFFSARNDDTR